VVSSCDSGGFAIRRSYFFCAHFTSRCRATPQLAPFCDHWRREPALGHSDTMERIINHSFASFLFGAKRVRATIIAMLFPSIATISPRAFAFYALRYLSFCSLTSFYGGDQYRAHAVASLLPNMPNLLRVFPVLLQCDYTPVGPPCRPSLNPSRDLTGAFPIRVHLYPTFSS